MQEALTGLKSAESAVQREDSKTNVQHLSSELGLLHNAELAEAKDIVKNTKKGPVAAAAAAAVDKLTKNPSALTKVDGGFADTRQVTLEQEFRHHIADTSGLKNNFVTQLNGSTRNHQAQQTSRASFTGPAQTATLEQYRMGLQGMAIGYLNAYQSEYAAGNKKAAQANLNSYNRLRKELEPNAPPVLLGSAPPS